MTSGMLVDQGVKSRADASLGVSHGAPAMSLIVHACVPTPGLGHRLDALKRSTQSRPTEIVVASDAPWADAPEGVRVVVSQSLSRGDKLDRAAEYAEGELLAFVDADAQLVDGWQDRAFEIFSDPTVAGAGGPQLLARQATYQQRASWTILSSRLGSGPLSYRFKRCAGRSVAEMPSSNLIVRKDAFKAVGGFQCPSPLGDDARLCYKLRTLTGLRVVYDPGLAVEASPPGLVRPLISTVVGWGKQRGDLARRLPETTRVTHVAPAFGLPIVLLALVASPFNVVARLALLAVFGAYFLAGVWMLVRSREPRTGLMAGLSLSVMHLAYAVSFWKGYLGRPLGEIKPGRGRNTPVRILIFNWRDVTHPWAGGAEAYMHELARRWVRAGCEVGWISERYRTGKRVEVIDGIRFHRVGGQRTLYPLVAFAYLWRLRNRYDVLVDCENGIPFFTPLYSQKPSVLVVFHLHNEVFQRELPPYLRLLAVWLEGWLMPRVYHHKAVVTISPSTFSQLLARGYKADRITVVTPGVDVPRTPPNVERSKSPLVIYLGRLKGYKGVDILIRALPRVLSRFPDVRLAIVGQGPERDRLERLGWSLGLAACVRFYGYLERQAKDQLLAEAWTAVCPSAFEGWGVVCLEASASGIPVVAARVSGLVDAVLDGETGTLVPYGDASSLADALIDLLSDKSRRDAMGVAGQAWAATHNWDQSAAAFLDTLMRVTAGHVSATLGLSPEMLPTTQGD